MHEGSEISSARTLRGQANQLPRGTLRLDNLCADNLKYSPACCDSALESQLNWFDIDLVLIPSGLGYRS